jgi:Uma2 family endonuclease
MMPLIPGRTRMMAHARNSVLGRNFQMRMALDTRAWTVGDLDGMPDDGQRYEVIDGRLFVTPAPSLRHQDAILALAAILRPYVIQQAIGHLVISPADVKFSSQRGVQPDLFVARLVGGERPRNSSDIRGLLLAVEVLSPSTAKADRVDKRALYRDERVDEYWVVDLEARRFERSTPADTTVELAAATLRWRPAGAGDALNLDVKRYFAEVLDDDPRGTNTIRAQN